MRIAEGDVSTTFCWFGVDYEVDLPACRQAIVNHLLAQGKHLQQLAEDAGVSRMSLWRFMSGKQPSPQTVHRILAAIGLDPQAVLRCPN